MDIIAAFGWSCLIRFFSLRKKARTPENTGIEITLPEWFKLLITFMLMFVWIKLVDIFFNAL